jgi:hypothetical protein
MQIIKAAAFLAVAMWAGAASAQKTYSLSVSVHDSLQPLSEVDVRAVLSDASRTLQKDANHVDTDGDVACNVAFALKGPIRRFGSPDTPAIVDESHIEAIHRVDADVGDVDFHVKVVKEIKFCRQGPPSEFHGCSFPSRFRSIIVVHQPGFPDHLLWPHEFGHLTGLPHRIEPGVAASLGQPHALMTPCGTGRLSNTSVQVNRAECDSLLSGPKSFNPPLVTCPAQ